jgi:hypothetical protein
MQSLENISGPAVHPQCVTSKERRPTRAESSADWSLSLEQYRQVLPGMLAEGHGIQALCLFLTLTRDALLDLVVQLNLPTPHDRPIRRPGGKVVWQPSDFPVLLRGWLENWSAACLADQLRRSRGAIWSKTRRMGLMKRDRRLLHWPEYLLPAASPPPETVLVPDPVPPRSKKRLPERWRVAGTDIELTSKRNGTEVDWANNTAALVELGMRAWGGQRVAKIADDFGVSYRAITSQLHWLRVEDQPRGEQTDDYDREKAEAAIRKAGYKMFFCKSDGRFPYWADRVRRTRSRRDEKSGFYDATLG